MKKIHALVSLGAFLACIGILSPTYAYPRLAVVPQDLSSRVVAQSPEGEKATYFSVADLAEKQLALRSITSAQVDGIASREVSEELAREVLVVQIYACTDLTTVDCQTTPLPIAGTVSRYAIDPRTALPVPWPDASIETGGGTERGVEFKGLTIKFPFNVEKKDYQFWNPDLRDTVPVEYVGESTLSGLAVYHFRQTLGPTVIGTLDLPGMLIGSDRPSVTADRVTSGETNYFVEPETGVIISAVADLDSYAEVDGHKVLTIVQGSFTSPDSAIDESISDYKTQAAALYILRVIAPRVGTPLGVLLIALALFLRARLVRRSSPAAASTPVTGLDGGARNHAAGARAR